MTLMCVRSILHEQENRLINYNISGTVVPLRAQQMSLSDQYFFLPSPKLRPTSVSSENIRRCTLYGKTSVATSTRMTFSIADVANDMTT